MKDSEYKELVMRCIPFIKELLNDNIGAVVKQHDTFDDALHTFIAYKLPNIIKLWRSDTDASFNTYLCASVINFIKDSTLKKDKIRSSTMLLDEARAVEEMMPTREEDVRLSVDKHLLHDYVAMLPPSEQVAVRIFYMLEPYTYSMTVSEKAAEVGVCKSSYYNYVKRGEKLLREMMK